MNRRLSAATVCSREHEWAVILAGGDGTRLKSLTRKIAGDERPKQFCSVLGTRTLLEETQQRVALELSPKRTLYVVNRAHENFYAPLLASEPAQNILAQPGNRGTAPAILWSLLRIASLDPDAIAAFFPSDHYTSDNARFMAHIRSALDAARAKLDRIVLLGLEPTGPEMEYGWIETGGPIDGHTQIFNVRRFWEKPNRWLAEVLQLRGCLWNSFVMAGSVQALLGIIQSAMPDFYRFFTRRCRTSGSRAESNALAELYQLIPEVNFSHEVLACRPDRLAALKVTGVRWNDLGEPKRVIASLRMAGVRPAWAEADLPLFA